MYIKDMNDSRVIHIPFTVRKATVKLFISTDQGMCMTRRYNYIHERSPHATEIMHPVNDGQTETDWPLGTDAFDVWKVSLEMFESHIRNGLTRSLSS